MKASGNLPNSVQTIIDLIKRLSALYLENAKLTAAEKLTVILSAGVLLVISIVLGVFALAFISGVCIELLALVMPAWASYAMLAAIFVLLAVIVFIFKKALIVNPIARFVSKLVFESHNGMKNGNEL